MDFEKIILGVRKSIWLSKIWDFHERWSPLRFFANSDAIVDDAIRQLRLAFEGNRRVVIVFNRSTSPPGLGDVLSVAILARGLSLYCEVSIQILDSEENLTSNVANRREDRSAQAVAIIKTFAPQVRTETRAKVEITPNSEYVVLFEDEVKKNRDVTRYMLLLIRNLVIGLNFKLEDFGFAGLAREKDIIGYPVRRALESPDRNTDESTFLLDLKVISEEFPGACLKLFGFADEVSYFVNLAESAQAQVKIISQRSDNFLDAAFEAARCSLWVQRLGGGIAIPIFFSKVPFVFFSRDSVMARQLKLDAKAKRLFPWHTDNQFYLLAPFRARRKSLAGVLRRLRPKRVEA
jgi:hypothetical protein